MTSAQITKLHAIHVALILALEQCRERLRQLEEEAEEEKWEAQYGTLPPYYDSVGLFTGVPMVWVRPILTSEEREKRRKKFYEDLAEFLERGGKL